VICFECARTEVYVDGRRLWLDTSPAANPLFDQLVPDPTR
jgi:hypothetical protein